MHKNANLLPYQALLAAMGGDLPDSINLRSGVIPVRMLREYRNRDPRALKVPSPSILPGKTVTAMSLEESFAAGVLQELEGANLSEGELKTLVKRAGVRYGEKCAKLIEKHAAMRLRPNMARMAPRQMTHLRPSAPTLPGLGSIGNPSVDAAQQIARTIEMRPRVSPTDFEPIPPRPINRFDQSELYRFPDPLDGRNSGWEVNNLLENRAAIPHGASMIRHQVDPEVLPYRLRGEDINKRYREWRAGLSEAERSGPSAVPDVNPTRPIPDAPQGPSRPSLQDELNDGYARSGGADGGGAPAVGAGGGLPSWMTDNMLTRNPMAAGVAGAGALSAMDMMGYGPTGQVGGTGAALVQRAMETGQGLIQEGPVGAALASAGYDPGKVKQSVSMMEQLGHGVEQISDFLTQMLGPFLLQNFGIDLSQYEPMQRIALILGGGMLLGGLGAGIGGLMGGQPNLGAGLGAAGALAGLGSLAYANGMYPGAEG